MRRLLVIRHGETQWNRARRWQGWIDTELTTAGEEQAAERARLLAEGGGLVGYRLFTSDLRRAHRTAELLAEALGGASPIAEPGLRERHGGEWQGCTAEEIDERWPGRRDAWRRGEIDAPPAGESDAALWDRVHAALHRCIAGTPVGSICVAVTHGGVLRVVTQQAGADFAGAPNLGGRWFGWDAGALHPGEDLEPLLSQVRDRPEVE